MDSGLPHLTTMTYDSPCGTLILGAAGGELHMCDWVYGSHRGRILSLFDPPHDTSDHTRCRPSVNDNILSEAVRQLDEYFAGTRRGFSIPLVIRGTDFQRSVRTRLAQIPFGQTMSYTDLAQDIGSPRGVRAVANALASNPLSIFIPCHRVVGISGNLTGYAGGLEAKRYLLNLERNDY